ncbi:hypothetical protein DEI93_02160 [Curtobacterium sp. MCBD17_035]|uniref:hypothetical protein n=1 Tax=Curtobacterium sp. MCBD17_035 TaxID=2175673 RepID=UPI000DAA2690|nr:hypothetical protein [Curtobacterium sp. MCBD17_035]WIB67868.1 hypothetical protein DEI93_02160 [Curtobacterium sp. MCBD17_035]
MERAAALGRSARTNDEHSVHVRDVSVDTALVIEAARQVVTTRIATRASLTRHLYVAPEIADDLLAKLEHCEVIGPNAPGRRRHVITTSGELPGIIEEFRRRG